MTLGAASGFAGFTVSNAYNDRLQPILLFASSPTATVFSECYDFHLGVAITQPSPCSFSASATGDNGNVYQVVNNRDTTRTQSFLYDSLNRINTAQSSGTQWGETFTIDAWGNLTNRAEISGKSNYEPLNAAPATAQNQLTGFCNDAAGNLVLNSSSCPQPPGTPINNPSYYYDAENHLIWTSGYRYIYDGDGERVEKCAAANQTSACPTSGTTGTLYWRGAGSDTLDESDLGGNPEEEYIFFGSQRIARRDVTSTGQTVEVHYYFSDHIGSHGVIENATGTNCEQDIDYYPYGGQQSDYCPNVPQKYKFNGKERDTESGLDNFGARYDASGLGRFMTPDWAAQPTAVPYAHFGNPQSLNLYSYVNNNPTTLSDPDGHDFGCNGGKNWTQCLLVTDPCADLSDCTSSYGDNGGQGFYFFTLPAYEEQLDLANGSQEKHDWFWKVLHALGIVETEAEKKAREVAFQQAKTRWEKAHPGRSYALYLLNLQLQLTPMAGFSIEGEGAGLLGEAAANANKLNHIFGKAAHNLQALVSEFGSQEAAYNALRQATQAAVSQQGLTGVFEISVKVGSQTVTVRGTVVNGVAEIGTAFK